MEKCDHKLGRVVVFTRPWWRLFRKTFWSRCWFCDVKERCYANGSTWHSKVD